MITLVVPTMNRSEFVIRLLKYYASTGYEYRISIGDSSTGWHLERTKKEIQKIGNKLKINFKEYPGVNVADCLRALIETTTTPYIAILPDDDFFVTEGLYRCADFLEKHPDYISVHGKAVILSLNNSKAFGTVVSVSSYPQPVLEAKSARERVYDLLTNYRTILFSLYRTGDMKHIFKDNKIKDIAFAAEKMPSCISAALGKCGYVDSLYLVRTVHDKRYLLPDMFDDLTRIDWAQSYIIFESILSKEIAEIDGIEIELAKKTIKKAYLNYMIPCLLSLKRELDNSENIAKSEKNRKATKGKAILKQLLRSVRALRYKLLPSRTDRLESILSPYSRYKKDFLPIYRIITEGVKDQ